MTLATLQQAMTGYLTNAPGNDFAAQMQHAPGLSVYQNNYRGSLMACLKDTYEKCWAWLGDEGFEAAAQQHIDLHPSHSWTLDAYGHDFPETLRILYPDDPEVSELAWLEWAMRRAFDGPDATPIEAAQLGNVDWENARFKMVPTLVLGRVTTNASALWSALDEDIAPPAVETLAQPATLCVWRQDLSPCFRTIESRDARLLQMALSGETFGHICQSLSADMDENAAQVAGVALGTWLKDGLIVEVK